jgi:hypothetical protein
MRWRDIVRKETATEPVKPLTPAASGKHAKRQDNINQQIQTTQSIQAPRVSGRRTKLADA